MIYCIFMAVLGAFVGIGMAELMGIIVPTTAGTLVMVIIAVMLVGLCWLMYRERTR